jgi:hypothetical protein
MILLSRPYGGYTAGTIVQFSTTIEAALVAQGFGTVSAGPVTPGAVTTNQPSGRVGIAAAGTSVVVTNPNITTESKFAAWLSNGTADTTALYITRIVPANGSVTFHLNAAATAAVAIDWAVLGPFGGLVTTA